ncbi:hypothetical protein RugamoR64_39530 [Duganella rhizosphaerae]|uniref:hypothetical protein n=1 Tax=Duganella rhizosphaerae TaxID=2885763 RepID=UPI0030E831C7
MSYDKEVPGCFGSSALSFAGHPADEDRAFEWLKSLRERNVGHQEALNQIKSYLQLNGASAAHVSAQVAEASRYLKPWLLD